MTSSDTKPTIRRLQGKILFPVDIERVEATEERPAHYRYNLLEIPDKGQRIDDETVFIRNNYAELRRSRYGAFNEQFDMMFHGTWEEHVRKVKAEFPKP